MAGRGTSQNVQNELLVQMVATLQHMNESLRSLNQNPASSPSSQNLVPLGPAEYQGLDEFRKRNPSQFHGGFAPDAALEWIQGIERIFRAMNCSEAQKLAYATYMLGTEAENWWEFTRRQMETEGQLISWTTFKAKFLHKYFPADLKRQKEMEFLKLEQDNMSVGEYAAKFEVLVRFCPYSELEMDGRSKCSKFESGLRSKLKRMFRHQEIANFATLVNKCRMYEDDLKVDELTTPETISPRNYGPQRNNMRERGKGRVEDDRKPYAVTTRHRDRSFQRSSPPTVPTDKVSTPMCIKCGRLHYGSTYPWKGNGCFHYKELGHIKRFCPKLDRRLNVIHAEEARDHGRKGTPSRAWTSGVDDPARGKSHGDSVDMRIDVPVGFNPGNGLAYQSWKSRLSERFSPERERIPWEGQILGYTGGFSPERELSRLGEKWQFGVVDTVRFSLERESLA
ncbi:hypothetical protein Lal_00042738 [Lupinus albus]|nr:hypothetical protein Lal_00042738 [Lupinus albus]